MSPGRASEAQAREEIDCLQRSGPRDAFVGRKSAISEYEPDADLRDTVQVPLLDDRYIWRSSAARDCRTAG